MDAIRIPQQLIGPVAITGEALSESVMVPLATYETPLWPSCKRGAAVTARAGGIHATVVRDFMARSILLEANSAEIANRELRKILAAKDELAAVVAGSSRFARLVDLHAQLTSRFIFLRIEVSTGDASGHNMVTLAADRAMGWLLEHHPDLTYGSVSGNFCTDKKVSAVNSILGRGKHVIAESAIPAKLVSRYLKTTAKAIADLNQRKNLLGSMVAGSLASGNAHFANMLLAFYLATGQDAANIVEGSQGITHAEDRDGDLYFSVTLPNIIVGSVGNGKNLPETRENLEQLGCLADRPAGANGRRLAAIGAAIVLCGELSLLAALTNPGELMAAHQRLERE
jgi:hydroxymethylglutaryl-CoA reductase (NADPH)